MVELAKGIFARKLVRGVLAVVAVMGLAVFFLQEKLLFYPEKLPENYVFESKFPLEERWLEVDGTKIHTLYFRGKEASGLILYFHGNAGNLASWGGVGEELVERTGWDVWMVDYPGYGKSGGMITSEDQLHDIALALYSAGNATGHTKIAAMGRSIGSGLALKLASQMPLQGLVLETPYYSLARLAKEKFPWVPGFLLRYPIRSYEWMPKVTAPVLFLHGREDEIIPYAHSEDLLKLAPEGKAKLVTFERGRHNDLSSHEPYWQAVAEFFKSL